MKITSRSAARRASIRWPTIRTTCTSSGSPRRLMAAASWRSKTRARRLRRLDDETLKAVPLLAGFRVVPYFALTRFGKWDEMLREPEPPAISAYMRGNWHYARGTAFLGKGQTDRSRAGTREVERDNGRTSRSTSHCFRQTPAAQSFRSRRKFWLARLPRRKRITTQAVGAS